MSKKLVVAIIQARMSSKRLPGKVLLPLAGKPVISHIVERARMCRHVSDVIVATSSETSDDELAEFCKDNDILCFRGSLNNVLSRFEEIIKLTSCKYIVRITGDCPLIHPEFIDAQIEALIKYDGDILWSEKESSVLEGQGVISSKAILTVAEESTSLVDLEHVGSRYFTTHLEKFKFIEMIIPEKFFLVNHRLTIDETEDYEFLSTIYSKSWSDNPVSLDEVLYWLNDVNKSDVTNRNVQHSDINKELKDKRSRLKPKIVGTFEWNCI